MRRLARLLMAAVAVLVAARRKPHPDPGERIVPDAPAQPRAELAVIGLLLLGGAFAIAFIVVYALDTIPNQTQWLGLCLGLSLLAIASALILVGKRLIVTEELVDDYPAEEHTADQRMVVQTIEESGSRITRSRLLKVGGVVSGGSLGLALLAPVASLGPVLDLDPLYRTPWRAGRRLVDEEGHPYRASDIEPANMYTAFPEGASTEDIASPVNVVRLSPRELALPSDIAHYPAPGGIVGFSKICTHAGCALTLYRAPLFAKVDPKPAFVCPCHYSTFDPTTGGSVIFGPAGRPLPMLPLTVDGSGFLRAAGNFNQPIGPSWWGVRLRGPKP